MSEPTLTRRDCLRQGTGALVVAGLAAAGGWWLHNRAERRRGVPLRREVYIPDYFADVAEPARGPCLSVAAGESAIEQLVRVAVAGLDPQRGMRRFIQSGDVVLIKPNAGFDRPAHLGATTHPEVLRAVIRLCREAGAARILVTDNPIESPAACFARSGIEAVVRAEHARLVWPDADRFELVATGAALAGSDGAGLPAHWPVLYEPLAAATKLIGVAPIKDHNLAGGSMLLKNWYGLLGGRRNQFHQAIQQTIGDLGALFSPTLVIADGTRVMLRSGPTGGRTSDVRPGGRWGRPVIVAATDPLACDSWCYENLLGRDPADLTCLERAARHIRSQVAAGRQRLGQPDWRQYERQGRLVVNSV